MKKSLSFLIVTLLLTQAVFCKSTKLQTRNLTIIRKNGTTISVNAEIAIKPEELQRGFMERKNIPDGTGMLFVFQQEQYLSFWMKNTPTPLSIAYINCDGIICDIFDMKPYSLENINSTVPVLYALEVPKGWFKKNNITVGDVINVF
ncbi:MAG: DUF192 domain-containing protein [Spirochaetia bacterium]|nr:DUF192 domain-containing protein [Spirochaetia bacterium]